VKEHSLDTTAFLTVFALVVEGLLDDIQVEGRKGGTREELQLREYYKKKERVRIPQHLKWPKRTRH
jgi:hypothetical protein